MTYKDYLRLLLFLVPLEEKCFRTMELVEERMCASGRYFSIERAVSRALVTVTGQAGGRNVEVEIRYGY